MVRGMPRPNAAIYFARDAFDTSRPRLMGRHAAGEGFLRGFVRHGGIDRVLEAQTAYLESRLGPVRRSLPQLPVIPLGVDCDAYMPAPVLRESWRQQLGIAAQDVAVLFLGRLSFHGKAHPVPMYRGL